jgi:hypothetical protein
LRQFRHRNGHIARTSRGRIRRILEAEGFDEQLTPELREREAPMREQVEGKS